MIWNNFVNFEIFFVDNVVKRNKVGVINVFGVLFYSFIVSLIRVYIENVFDNEVIFSYCVKKVCGCGVFNFYIISD